MNDRPSAESNSRPRNDELLPEANKIRAKLKAGYPRTPFNILVVGQPGAGKSSLINSLITAIDQNGYLEHTKVGSGGKAEEVAVTSGYTAVKMFENELDYKEEKEFKCRLTFWDFPGLMDDYEKRLLRMVLKGHLPSETALAPMRSWRYWLWDWWNGPASADKRIHLIIYVHDATVPPAENLLESIVNLVTTTADMTYETTTMLVMTHVDKLALTKEEKTSVGGRDDPAKLMEAEDKIKQDKLDQTTEKVAACLKMKDVWPRIFQLSCYCTSTDDRKCDRKHQIDKNMCQLWEKIIQPQYYKQFNT